MIGFLLLVLLCFPALASAVCQGSSPNWVAVSANRQDVQDCIDAVIDGPTRSTITVNGPADVNWPSNAGTAKHIWLKANGTVIIRNTNPQSNPNIPMLSVHESTFGNRSE